MARAPAGSSGVSIQVDGVGKLHTDLKTLINALGDLGVMKDIAAQAAELARSFAPRKSGRLAESIRSSKAKNRATVSAGRKAVPYAAVINYGWPKRRITASGFMQKADDAMKPKLPGLIENGIERLIRERRLS